MFRRLQRYKWKPPSGRVYRVIALDGSTLTYELETRAKGVDLLQLVLRDLAVPEGDYFGLFQAQQWIVLNKTLKKQLKDNRSNLLYFGVEVYPKDHNTLLSPTTRYQIFLQAKKDLLNQRLVCSNGEITDRLQTFLSAEDTTCSLTEKKAAENFSCYLGDSKRERRLPDDCVREFLEVAQLEDTFGTFVYSVFDSSHHPLSLTIGPCGLCIVEGSHVDWDSVSKVSSFGRHLTVLTTDTLGARAPPIVVRFSSSSLCCSVAAHCMRLKSLYSDLTYEDTKTKLKRLLSLRIGKNASGKPDNYRPTLKKTTSFSERFRSFRSRHAVLAGHSLENITQSAPHLTPLQPMQLRSTSPAQCLSLSLTPPSSPTPPPPPFDVTGPTGSCFQTERLDKPHPLASCDIYTHQQCAELGSHIGYGDGADYSSHSEIGNLDDILQALDEKLKEQRSTICSYQDHHVTACATMRKKSVTSDTYLGLQKHQCCGAALHKDRMWCWIHLAPPEHSRPIVSTHTYRSPCAKSHV